jgi:UDP-N-acetylglucosamine:LPS N-acetylglucosamine transferase
MDLFMLQQISLFLAGASVSELSIVGKPVIFIPLKCSGRSSNKNAKAIVEKMVFY